jgi:hypothetical protein
MRQVWVHNIANFYLRCHLYTILIGSNDKLESPETIFWKAKSAAYGWASGVAKEPKVDREEEVIDLFRRVS